jgi:gluconokinase
MAGQAIVTMGVAGCGKSTLGEALAAALGCRFVEGDRLHSPANVAKMAAGTPLTDEDRWPWLAEVGRTLRGETTIIASCSALKRAYRDLIRREAGRPVTFLHLHGDTALLAERMAARQGHFMPPALLDSQLATLEMPGADEGAIRIDIALPVAAQVERALAALSESGAR